MPTTCHRRAALACNLGRRAKARSAIHGASPSRGPTSWFHLRFPTTPVVQGSQRGSLRQAAFPDPFRTRPWASVWALPLVRTQRTLHDWAVALDGHEFQAFIDTLPRVCTTARRQKFRRLVEAARCLASQPCKRSGRVGPGRSRRAFHGPFVGVLR